LLGVISNVIQSVDAEAASVSDFQLCSPGINATPACILLSYVDRCDPEA
jgi:hypothetical protein